MVIYLMMCWRPKKSDELTSMTRLLNAARTSKEKLWYKPGRSKGEVREKLGRSMEKPGRSQEKLGKARKS